MPEVQKYYKKQNNVPWRQIGKYHGGFCVDEQVRVFVRVVVC